VLLSKNKAARSLALIDSGASVSILNLDIAGQLGIEIESGTKTTLAGVSGRIAGYIHKVKMRVSGKTFICPVVFSREYKASFNLLGRKAFFEKFKITFDEAQKRVILV